MVTPTPSPSAPATPAPSASPGDYVPGQAYGAPGTATAAGANGVNLTGIAPQSISGQYWDPTKSAFITDNRPVPGYVKSGAVSTNPMDAANPQFHDSSTWATIGDAMNQLLTFGQNSDPDTIIAFQDSLIKGGFLNPAKTNFQYGVIGATGDPTYSAYFGLLEQAIRTKTDYTAILNDRIARDAGKKYETALTTIKDKADAAAARAKRVEAANAAALLPSQVNRTTTNIADPLSAQSLITPVLTNALGRPPTTDDLTQFTQALQQAQASSPTLTTGTASPAISGGGDRTTTTTGGFDPQQFTANYVNQHYGKEAGAVGETTDFYNAALQALSSSGGR